MNANNHPLIEFRNITVMRGKNKAVDNIDLKIEAGENVAIIGPNGSGKSTFIKCITKECYPVWNKKSSIKVFGESFWDVFELRKMLGIVSNDLQLLCRKELTALDLVLSGYFSSVGVFSHQFVTPKMKKEAKDTLEFLGISHLQNRLMTDMSTGEERRTLIARALVHNPAALILDEPTNGLDIAASARFRTLLSRIALSGKSVIMVTHNLIDVVPEINRVILLKKGHIYKDGTKEDLITNSNLSDVFGMTVNVEQKSGCYYLSMC